MKINSERQELESLMRRLPPNQYQGYFEYAQEIDDSQLRKVLFEVRIRLSDFSEVEQLANVQTNSAGA